MSQNKQEKTQEAYILYRTLEDCRIGGFFRRKGETILLPKTTASFSFLEVVEETHETKPHQTKNPRVKTPRTKKAQRTSQNNITQEDLGIGKPMSSSNVTSADMVTK